MHKQHTFVSRCSAMTATPTEITETWSPRQLTILYITKALTHTRTSIHTRASVFPFNCIGSCVVGCCDQYTTSSVFGVCRARSCGCMCSESDGIVCIFVHFDFMVGTVLLRSLCVCLGGSVNIILVRQCCRGICGNSRPSSPLVNDERINEWIWVLRFVG